MRTCATACTPPSANEHGDVTVGERLLVQLIDEVRDLPGLLVLRGGPPYDDLRCIRGWAIRAHVLVESTRNRLREYGLGVDDLPATASVRGDVELPHARIARDERRDVPDVRPAPLVDGLTVIANHAELGATGTEPFDEQLLRRVTSWYSPTMRWQSDAWTPSRTAGRSSSFTARTSWRPNVSSR